MTGPGSMGSPERESALGGRFPIGSNTPTPAREVVPAGVVEGAGFALTRTLSEEDAAAACGEVPVALRVMRVPAAFRGAATAARNWTGRRHLHRGDASGRRA